MIPVATYRLQFTPSFDFQEARRILTYLVDLGVSHIYASPVLKSRKGSQHGYDVVDPTRINPELGGHDTFMSLVSEVHRCGLFWLQDIVPNHMAIDSDNHMLMDVLESGPLSPYHDYFAIDWNHPYQNMTGRLLVPVLGRFYAECLLNGELQLKCDENGLSVNYYRLRLPLKIESYATVFGHNIESLENRLGRNNPIFVKFVGNLNFLRSLGGVEKPDAISPQIRHAKRILWRLYNESDEIRQFIGDNVAFFNGKKGDAASFDALDGIISEQRFRLSFWKVATEEINYRRFFTVNDLISLRVENDMVFDDIHRLIKQLVREKILDGLRVDHIDGLHDPAAYLNRLRDCVGDTYLVVEKILQSSEMIPSSWPVQGTTGYDFLGKINNLLCDVDNGDAFSKIYYRYTGLAVLYETMVAQKKRLILAKHMAGNIDNLSRMLKRISSGDRKGQDITLYGLRRALVAIMSYFPVYRTYINFDSITNDDGDNIRHALQKAHAANPDLAYELNFLESYLLLNSNNTQSNQERQKIVDFVLTFQQFTGPLMAKGVEDTIMYVYNRLISLNEVGSDPIEFGSSVEEVHRFNRERYVTTPHSLNATSTHDTKRGEDVRARIAVLSEMPREWEYHLKSWSRINRKRRRRIGTEYVPDRNDEYFLYQTLIGVWPFADPDNTFADRIKSYVVKAVREAKVHTAWIAPDTDYEEAYLAFLALILKPAEQNRFLREFLPFQRKIAFFGIFNSLSQTLIKLTAPGVPDFYQGSELWDLNLVDPDNRRPVDFDRRREILRKLRETARDRLPELLAEMRTAPEDGRIKMFLTYRSLAARKANRVLFEDGVYIPLVVEGNHQRNLFAFARNHESKWAITIAPRLFTELTEEGVWPLGGDTWHDTRLVLPEGTPAEFVDVLTGRTVKTDSRRLKLADTLTELPVALLMNASQVHGSVNGLSDLRA